MICRNAISKNNIKTPDMGKDDLISQLEFSFDIKIDNIDDINEEFYLDSKRHEYDDKPSTDAESESFDIFLCV